MPKKRSKEEAKKAKNESRKTFKNKHPKQSRKCLRCPRSFMSTGPGNRICPKCTDKFIEGSVKEYKITYGKNIYFE